MSLCRLCGGPGHLLWLFCLGLAACVSAEVDTDDSAHSDVAIPPLGCAAEALEPGSTVAVDDGRLTEVSGLAVSRAHRGTWWVHNDSGDTARIFAVSAATGAVTAEVTLADVQVTDVEDIAVGPCGSGWCLWVADIGDNEAVREHVTLYRLEEPAPDVDASVTSEALELTWQDGPVDSEAVWVDGVGELWAATKEPGSTRLARAEDGVWVPQLSLDIDDGLVTGADAVDGMLALRTYVSVLVYAGATEASITELAAGAPVRLEVSDEPQGEAVGLGEGLVTASEGTPALFHPWRCPTR